MIDKSSQFSDSLLSKLDTAAKQRDSSPVLATFETLRRELIPILERTEWGQRYVWETAFTTPYIGPREPVESRYMWLGLVDERYKSLPRASKALQFEFGLDANEATGFLGRDVMCGIVLGPWADDDIVATVSETLQTHSSRFAQFLNQYDEYVLESKSETFATPTGDTIETIAAEVDSGFAISRDLNWTELPELDIPRILCETLSQLTPVYRQLGGIADGPPVRSITSWDSNSLAAATTFDVSDITNSIERLMDAGCSRAEAIEYVRMYLKDMLRGKGLFAVRGVGPSRGHALNEAGITTLGELRTAEPDELAEKTTLAPKHVRSVQEAAQDGQFATLEPGDEQTSERLVDSDSRFRILDTTDQNSEDSSTTNETASHETSQSESNAGVNVLHVSDTHLQYEQYGTRERGTDFTEGFRRAVDLGLESEVDAIVHTGDILQNHDPQNEVVLDEAVEIIERATEAGVQFLYIVGNHDYEFSSGTESPLFDRIRDIDGTRRLGTDPTWVDDAVFYGIDHHYEDWWDENTVTLTPPAGEPAQTILCLHQSVPPVISAQSSECSLSELFADFSITVDTVLLGHLHQNHVRTVDATPSYYVGSPTRTNRAHKDYSPGAQVVQIENNTIRTERHSFTPRQFTEYTAVVGPNGVAELPEIGSVKGEVITVYIVTSFDDSSLKYDSVTHNIKQRLKQSGALFVGTSDRRGSLAGIESGIYDGPPVEVAHNRTEVEYCGSRRMDYPGFLQVGGTFLGRWNFTPGRRDEFFERFEELSNHAIASNLSTLVQTGNLFGNPSPPEEAINKAETALQVLQQAGVDSYHVRSQKEMGMGAIEKLVDAGLLNQLSSTPATVEDGRIALYGTDPTPKEVLQTARSMERAPVDHSILCTHVPVVPPADTDEPWKKAPDPIPYEELSEALPEWVDVVCTGGVRHSAVYEGTDSGPTVVCGGEAERLLGKYCFDSSPAEGHIWQHQLTPDGWQRTTHTLDKYPLETVELEAGFNADVDALAADVAGRADVEGAIVAIRLTGQRHAGNKFRREAFEKRLQAAYAVEVYDNREVPPEQR